MMSSLSRNQKAPRWVLTRGLLVLAVLCFWYGHALSLSTTSFIFRRRHKMDQQIQYPTFHTIITNKRMKSIVSLKASMEPQEGAALAVENSSTQPNGNNNKGNNEEENTTSNGEINEMRPQVFFAQEVGQEKSLVKTKEEEEDGDEDGPVQISVTTATVSSTAEENANDLRTAEALFDYDSAYVVFSSAIIGIICGFAVAVFKLSIIDGVPPTTLVLCQLLRLPSTTKLVAIDPAVLCSSVSALIFPSAITLSLQQS